MRRYSALISGLCLLFPSFAFPNYAPLAKELIKAAPKDTQFFLIGEGGGGQPESFLFVEALIQELGAEFSYLGLEIASNFQAKLDGAVKGGDASDLIQTNGPEAEAAFAKVLVRLSKENRSAYALDHPIKAGINPLSDFLKRDEYMLKRVREKGIGEGKAVILLGAAHVAKKRYGIPKELESVFGKGTIEPFGKLLLAEEPALNVVTIWFQPKLTEEETQRTAQAWQPAFKIGGVLPAKQVPLWSVDDVDFIAAEAALGEKSEIILSNSFDFYIRALEVAP